MTRQNLVFRGRRAIIIALSCLAFLYLAYVIGAFAALRGGALARLTRDSRDFKLETRGGYSFWPTRVVLRDVRIRFKDYNIEMGIEAREMSLSWSPSALFSKTIQIDELRARDARYEMLHRVEHARANRQRLAAFPDIGFARSKVYDSPRPPYGIPPFKIRVERIQANVLEAWILEFRATGNFETTGGFEVHENVTVFPSHVDLRGAQLFMGDKKLSSRFDCDVSAQVGPFLGRDPIEKALDVTVAKVLCDAEIDDLSAFQMYWPDSAFLLEGRGEFWADISAAAGKLEPSSVRASAELRRLGFDSAFLAGPARVAADIAPDGLVQLTGGLRGEQPPESSLDIEEVEFELALEQPKLLEMLLRRANAQVDGLGVRDPTLVRTVTESKGAPLVKLEQANLDLEYVAWTPERQGIFDFQSQGAVALFPAAQASITCPYQARLRCSLEEKSASCPGSRLACAPVAVSKGPDEKGTIAATIVADSLELTPERVSSEWLIALGNPKEILQSTVADNVWADLGLAVAPLGAVEGRIRVNRHQQTIAGTVDYARSGPFWTQGSFLFAESFVSRWRVDTPVGRFGVRQTQTGTTVTPFVGSDWGTPEALN